MANDARLLPRDETGTIWQAYGAMLKAVESLIRHFRTRRLFDAPWQVTPSPTDT